VQKMCPRHDLQGWPDLMQLSGTKPKIYRIRRKMRVSDWL